MVLRGRLPPRRLRPPSWRHGHCHIGSGASDTALTALLSAPDRGGQVVHRPPTAGRMRRLRTIGTPPTAERLATTGYHQAHCDPISSHHNLKSALEAVRATPWARDFYLPSTGGRVLDYSVLKPTRTDRSTGRTFILKAAFVKTVYGAKRTSRNTSKRPYMVQSRQTLQLAMRFANMTQSQSIIAFYLPSFRFDRHRKKRSSKTEKY